MACTLLLSPEERNPFGYILALEGGRLRHGTREHQEIGEGIRWIYDGLVAQPEGPVEIEFANDEMYMIGVRNNADISELEEYWLDNRASFRHRGGQAPFPDDDVELAIRKHYPEVIESPETFSFEPLRLTFLDIGFKVDAALTAGAPRVRGIYNKERAEIIRRTREVQAARALSRGRLYPRGVEIEVWRKAVRAEDLGPGEMVEVELDGTRIVVANVEGNFYALDGVCTHAPELGMIQGLAKGELDIERMCITCPWHGAQYNVRSGKAVRQPYAPEFNREHVVAGRLLSLVDVRRKAKDIRTYETKLEDDFVWVNVI